MSNRLSLHPIATTTVLAVVLALGSLPLGASDLLLDQPWDNLAYYDSTQTPTYSREVADDFDLFAEIDRVVAGGTSLSPDGVWVRFFDHSGNGPGALQAAYFLAAGDPGLVIGTSDFDRLDITLPEPFVATGQHYVSVQSVDTSTWYWWVSDPVGPTGTVGYTRTDGGPWTTVARDLCMKLYGTLNGAATIDSLGETSLPRSGFLEVFGNGFGSSGELLVDGHPAVVATWTNTRIAAYVSEAAGPGVVSVQVVTEGGSSNSVDLDVTLREPDGRLAWRVRMDALYSQVRPVVGADGTVYAVDVYDNLYAVSPDGEVLWMVQDAGSKGVDVGTDGTIYTGNEDWIKAFNPDGTEKWTFVQVPRAFILIDVAVGPDGNIYGVASSGMGVFSLTPDGVLRWTNPEPYDRLIVVYTEIVFGPGPDGQDQLYFSANSNTRAVRLSDGESIFTIGIVGQLVVSPVDGTAHAAYSALAPDGNQVWQFYEFLNGLQAVSGTGIHYNTTSMVTPRIYAVEPNGSERWSATLAETAGTVDVDPTESVLVVGTSGVLTSAPAVIGVDPANGSTQWRAELPPEEPDVPNPWTGGNGFHQFIDSKAAFSADGSMAFLHTAIAPGGVVTDRAFLYGIVLDPSVPPPSETLRSTDIFIKGRSRGSGVSILSQITVQDESLAPVSGATVHVTWTRPDGSETTATAKTSGQGRARFKVSGEGGFYTITVTDITKDGYVFDPDGSVLSKTIAWF